MITRREVLNTAIVGVALSLAARGGVASAATADSPRIVVDGLDCSRLDESFLSQLRLGGVHCVHLSVFGIAGPESFGAAHEFAAKHADAVTIATSVRDIRRARQDGKIALVLGWQHADILDATLRESSIYPTMSEALRAYSQLGLRIVGICYNKVNMFGGGCLDPQMPLTRVGQRLVEELHERRILLDVGGHTAERTSFDALSISKGVPVVCTHTNLAALNPNMRCISDRLAEAIANTGGVIGLTAINDFHVRNPQSARQHSDPSPQAPLQVHLDQYDYLKKLVGVEHIGLAPDFTTGMNAQDPPGGISIDWPGEESSAGLLRYVKDYEDISMLPNVVIGLRERGWSQAELDLMLGANWLRVYERAWGA